MKKNFILTALAATMITLTGCGMSGTANNTNNGQLIASGSSNGVASSNTGVTSSTLSTGLNLLSTLLGGNSVSSNNIVGTWTYASPEVSFESNNVLAGIGGELAANKVRNVLGTQLEKIGLKAGASTFTFGQDGVVKMTIKGRTTQGTYSLQGNTITLTGALGLKSVNATISIKNNRLYLLFDANALFNMVTKLGANSSTISGVLGNFNGMKMGWSMSK